MNTQRRPVFAPGISPRLARVRTSSGCICRKAAASSRVSVRKGGGPSLSRCAGVASKGIERPCVVPVV